MAVSDTNYNSTYALTALASQGEGLTAFGMGQKDLYNQLSELETNFNGTLGKLDDDSGVNDTDYESSYSADLNDLSSGHGLSQDDIVSFLDSFVANFNSTLGKLDSDTGVSDSDYNSTYALTDVVNNSKAMSTAVDDNGMLQGALVTLLTNIKTNVNGTLTKLDGDS